MNDRDLLGVDSDRSLSVREEGDILSPAMDGRRALDNFKGSGMDALAFDLLVRQRASYDHSAYATVPFHLKNWAVHPIMIRGDKEDDLSPAWRTVLVNPEGETLVFVSIGIVESLRTIVARLGKGPYEPALPICVLSTKTSRGFRVLSLTLAKG